MKIKPIWFALLLGGFAFVSLTLLVYAFIQKKEAERRASISIESEMRAIECEQRAVEANQQLQEALNVIAQKTQLLEQQAASKSKNKK